MTYIKTFWQRAASTIDTLRTHRNTAAMNAIKLQHQAEVHLRNLLKAAYQHWPSLPHSTLGSKDKHWQTPRIEWYQRGRAAGLAYPKQCLIRLSLPLGLQNPQELLHDTLPHELAHIVATRLHYPRRIRPHGEEWQNVCVRLLGRRLNRTHQMDVKTLKARRTRYIRFVDAGTGDEHWISALRVKRYGKHAFRSRRTGNLLLYQGEQRLL